MTKYRKLPLAFSKQKQTLDFRITYFYPAILFNAIHWVLEVPAAQSSTGILINGSSTLAGKLPEDLVSAV